MNNQFAFSGQADIYMRFLDAELDTGFFPVGDINEMTISSESEKKELVSNMKTRRGVLATVTGSTTHSISLKSKYFDKRTFAMRSGGVVSESDLTAKTITDETITSVKVGGLYPLEHQNIDTSQTITAKKGATVLTDADFEVTDGFLRVKAGGALADGDTVKVSYKTKATTRNTVKGGQHDKFAVAIMYKGINVADDNSQFDMLIHRAELSPDGDFSLIGDDFGEASFSGTLVLVDGEDSTYEYTTYG